MVISLLILACPNNSSLLESKKKLQPVSKKRSITITDLFIGDENSVENANKEFIAAIENNNIFHRHIVAAGLMNKAPFIYEFSFEQIEEKITKAVKMENMPAFISSIFNDEKTRDEILESIGVVAGLFTQHDKDLEKKYIKIILDKLGVKKEERYISSAISSHAKENNIEFLINILLSIVKDINVNLSIYKPLGSNKVRFDTDWEVIKTNFSHVWGVRLSRFLIDVASEVAENNGVELPDFE